jgi:uncharacterized protein (TIGR00730 family)
MKQQNSMLPFPLNGTEESIGMANNKKEPAPGGKQSPAPADRHDPLPWQHPKCIEEDPEGFRRVQSIINHPNYQRADQDPYFLKRAELRGMRLAFDYMKPEMLLTQHNIDNTVVCFGSARLCEPHEARRHLEALRAALEKNPEDATLKQRLPIAERVLEKSRYYDVAREFGRLVGEASRDHDGRNLVIMTGGGPGLMEAANRGAFDVGAKSVGLNISLPHEQYPNPYITPDLCFNFHYFALRKLHFMMRTKALVAFPGGFGTLDELFETLTLVQTRKLKPMPVVLVGEDYWRQAINIDFLAAEGVIDPEDRELFWYAEEAAEIWDSIVRWYDEVGEPILAER